LNGTTALQQKFAKARDFEKFMSADNDFHQQLYAATGNPGGFGTWCAAAAIGWPRWYIRSAVQLKRRDAVSGGAAYCRELIGQS